MIQNTVVSRLNDRSFCRVSSSLSSLDHFAESSFCRVPRFRFSSIIYPSHHLSESQPQDLKNVHHFAELGFSPAPSEPSFYRWWPCAAEGTACNSVMGVPEIAVTPLSNRLCLGEH